jgi:protein TonB
MLTKPPFSVATTHAPAEIPPTPPIPITSHAVTSDDYPDASIRLAEQGLVKIRYLVQADGTVGECAVITSSGSSRLDNAACTMVKRRWRFTPATQKGKPVAEYLLAEVSFELVPSSEN